MAQFETIVRPVVFPDIRPGPARTLPPEDNSEGGAVIRGNPASIISLSYSYSFSSSSSNSNETQRQVDEVRVYQKEDDGSINRENFVDIQVANKIWVEGMPQPSGDADNKETPAEQERRTAKKKWVDTYKQIEPAPNIDIIYKDKIIKNRKGSDE